MIDPPVLENCVQRFQNEPFVLAAWGHGSAFAGHMRPDSDVDFAILHEAGHPLDFKQRGLLVADLEDILHRRVDLGEVTTRNLVYAYQAICTGKRVYCRDTAATDEFTGRLLSLYADFKQDRAVVETAYCAG